jgi:hypothetical protein
VAEEQKPSWWKSLPGVLTAATGFIAALSGLVAGINQLGLFKREQTAAPVVITTPAPRDSMPAALRTDTARGIATAPAQSRQPPAVTAPRAPTSGAPSTAPTPASPSTTRTSPTRDPPSQQIRLPNGTVLELTVPRRSCAPAGSQQRFTARLAAPVKVAGETALRPNTSAVLHLRRGDAADGPMILLDSLVAQDQTIPVAASTVRIRRGADGAACLKADARLKATLGGPVMLRRR